MSETKRIKYFTKGMLIRANDEAIRTNRNRTLYPEKLEQLPDLKFPVGFSMIHNGHEMRVSIVVGPLPGPLQTVWLDIPFETYDSLPEFPEAEVPA
jgi:hypothetical protein